jgi:hypothetical protein
MKVWIIRGKYNYEVLREYYEEHPLRKDNNYQDGQYLYWTRDSRWEKKEIASIQTNNGSAKRAFKRAVNYMENCYNKYIIDIELLEIELVLPDGE